jgi:hypothetical protein
MDFTHNLNNLLEMSGTHGIIKQKKELRVMKKTELKGFIKGITAMLIVVAMIGTAYAMTGDQSITATYNNIKLVVDGTAVTPTDASGNTIEPFTYNGTVYLPVRAIATALGKDVTWDGDTNTVYLGAVPSGTTTSSPDTGSGTLGDYTVSIDSASLSTDYSGDNNVVIVTYTWTNNSSKNAEFCQAFNRDIFQNGIELSKAVMLTGSYTHDMVSTNIMSGTTDIVQEAYTLKNTTDSITVELSDGSNYSSDRPIIKKVLSLG